jgi:hypothetical protein
MINKKELIKEYKNKKHPAGLFAVKNKPENKMFIGASLNLPAKIRGITFELEMGKHSYSNLAEDYKRLGKDEFEISILDEIEYMEETEKELKKELETLEEIWVEKLKREGITFYNKK